MENRVKNVMATVFGISSDEVNDDSSPNTIPSWDSLKQMNLVILLEEEFDIEFSDEQVIRILNYKSLLEVIKEEIQ
jgi:acyl carrier protein